MHIYHESNFDMNLQFYSTTGVTPFGETWRIRFSPLTVPVHVGVNGRENLTNYSANSTLSVTSGAIL